MSLYLDKEYKISYQNVMLDNIPSPRSENQHGASGNAKWRAKQFSRRMHSVKDVIVRHQLVTPSRAVPVIEIDLDGLNIRVESRDKVGCVGC